ncbi:MAG: hypothetical protein QM784_29365 [Polyangiaceae bacterium]
MPRKKHALTLAEKLYIEGWRAGWKEGWREGFRQGYVEGRRKVLHHQLELKFGPIDVDTVTRLDAANRHLLFRYIERILTATTVEEVFADFGSDDHFPRN